MQKSPDQQQVVTVASTLSRQFPAISRGFRLDMTREADVQSDFNRPHVSASRLLRSILTAQAGMP